MEKYLPMVLGILFAVVSGMVGVIWAMLNAKIEREVKALEKELDAQRKNIATIFGNSEADRRRMESHHLEAMTTIYKERK